MDMPRKKDLEEDNYIRCMFDRISGRYDLMNRLMSFGRDMAWRRFMIYIANTPKGGRLLDIGTGTGDVAFEALRADPDVHVIGLDFTLEMMKTGQRRECSDRIGWCLGDALQLPFQEATFDAVTSGFLIRNVLDVRSAFREQVRVVKPGGRVVCLDTSPTRRNISWPFAMFHLKILIPFLGIMITGKKKAYKYLSASTLDFIEPGVLSEIMKGEGLEKVGFRRFMFGNIALHWGTRPVPDSTIR
jgi:demethylmenaquinone methyltransferase/2-methoxy-6-polyprenyl-1,4-benzoquinol methylase